MATRVTPTESRQITRADVDAHRLALRRVECEEHRRAELMCSDEAYYQRITRWAERHNLTMDEYEECWEAKNRDKIARILGYRPLGLIINGDPRGYALKIEPEHAGDLIKDWGGYGIVAPDKNA